MSILERLIAQHGCIDDDNFEDVVAQLTSSEREELMRELNEQRELIDRWKRKH